MHEEEKLPWWTFDNGNGNGNGSDNDTKKMSIPFEDDILIGERDNNQSNRMSETNVDRAKCRKIQQSIVLTIFMVLNI